MLLRRVWRGFRSRGLSDRLPLPPDSFKHHFCVTKVPFEMLVERVPGTGICSDNRREHARATDKRLCAEPRVGSVSSFRQHLIAAPQGVTIRPAQHGGSAWKLHHEVSGQSSLEGSPAGSPGIALPSRPCGPSAAVPGQSKQQDIRMDATIHSRSATIIHSSGSIILPERLLGRQTRSTSGPPPRACPPGERS